MKTLVMVFAVLVAAVLQENLPAWTMLGQAKAPLLLSVSLYYALSHERRLMLLSAILGGLLQDALGLIPLGYSSFCFCIVGLVVRRFRELIFVQQWMTDMLVGVLAAGTVTVMMSVLFVQGSITSFAFTWLMLKVMGSMVLAMVTVPLVFRALYKMDRWLGNVEVGWA